MSAYPEAPSTHPLGERPPRPGQTDAAPALAGEQARRAALLAGDGDALASLLSPELVYVHSTGARDRRDSYVEKIRSGALRYLNLDFEDLQAVSAGEGVVVLTGRMQATVRRDGQDRAVRSLYLAVWVRRDDANGWWMVAHQGTPLP